MDDSIKQSFAELKTKQQHAYSNLQSVEDQIRLRHSIKRRAVLTGQELDTMPEEANMYKNIGRAYVLTPKPQLLAELSTSAESADEDIKRLEANREALVKELQRLKEEVNELMRAHPGLIRVIREEFA